MLSFLPLLAANTHFLQGRSAWKVTLFIFCSCRMTLKINVILALWCFMIFGDGVLAATFPVNQCPADRYGANLNCSANDVRFAGNPEVLSINGAPNATTCPAGTQVSMDLKFTLETAPNKRYNIGLYVGNDAKDISLMSSSGGNATCSNFSFPNNAEGFKNLDGNVCGDENGDPRTLTPTVTGLVVDCMPDANGKVTLPAALSWEQNAGNATSCLGPQSIVPGTSSKCTASPSEGLGLPVTSLATLTIRKVVVIGDDTTSFPFLASGTSGPNPETVTPDSFSLSDGQSQAITIPYGTGPTASITVKENQLPGWHLRAIRCQDSQGNPAYFVTIDRLNGQVVAQFDAQHTAALCTYYNFNLPLPPAADLGVNTVASDMTPNVGDEITFIVTAKNYGPADATGVTATDALPDGYTFVSADPDSPGVYDPATGVWTIGDLASERITSMELVAIVERTGDYTNTALVSGDVIDVNPSNDTDSVTPIPKIIDLTIVKTVDNPTPLVGENIVFTLKATNSGPANATGVTVRDVLPSGYTLVSATASQGSYAAGVWGIGTLAKAASASLQITATVGGAGVYRNVATIRGNETESKVDNNLSAAIVEPSSAADLVVNKTVNNPTPSVGENVIFTITATNNGPSTANNVEVTDQLPSGYTLVALNPSKGTVTANVWDIGTLANGETASLEIMAKVNASGEYANTATISGLEPDPDPGNNTSTITPMPTPLADLAVVKTVSDATPDVGDNVTFTITVTNLGPSATTGVVVYDTLPSGYTVVSSTPSQGTISAGVWTVGDLAAGASADLVVVATVKATGSYTNTAMVSGNQPDPVPGNNTSTLTPSVTPPVPEPQADLQVVKTVSNPTPAIGQDVTFTITVTNLGPSIATGVVVYDSLPSGYTVVSTTPSQGTISAGVWTVGDLAAGVGADLVVVATVKATGSYTNTAMVSGNQPDPVPGNNTSTLTPSVTPPVPEPQADLQVVKTMSNPRPSVGQEITFTLTVTNNGPSPASGVMVYDTLPSGYVVLSTTPSQGAITSGVWSVGDLAVGANATLTMVARVRASGSYTNTAMVSGDQQDPNPANNISTVTPVVYLDVPVGQADLLITKTVSNPTPTIGQNVTFTITVTNLGPTAATGVVVYDTLPSGYTVVSTKPSQGTISTGVWTVGGLVADGSARLEVVATVKVTGACTNTATVSGNQPDPVPGNNTSTLTPSITIPPLPADLAITKTVSNPTPAIGGTVNFTIVVTNQGPSLATGVTVADQLPSGYTLLSATPSKGVFANGFWIIGVLAKDADATLQIVARVNAAGVYLNTASVSGNQPDPDPIDNASAAIVTPLRPPMPQPIPALPLPLTGLLMVVMVLGAVAGLFRRN